MIQSVVFEPRNKRKVSTIRHGVGWPWSRICTCTTTKELSIIKFESVRTINVPFDDRLTNDGDVEGDNSNVIFPFKSWS